MAKKYETLFILKPDLSEDEVGENLKPIISHIEGDGGSVIAEDRWGKKRLAYPIKKHKYGYYLLLKHEGPKGETIAKIDRVTRLSENILKAMTVKPSPSWDLPKAEESEAKETPAKKAEEPTKTEEPAKVEASTEVEAPVVKAEEPAKVEESAKVEASTEVEAPVVKAEEGSEDGKPE
ncbi:SSU ribosomal protein S6p [hydrothermal vent metagenome]|uniref:SSU ribosomal protein S6p n=1 Tax=hydrothermal vent metagenome TaxID=652676 RepID=A0A3B1CJT5_9ZZZZ